MKNRRKNKTVLSSFTHNRKVVLQNQLKDDPQFSLKIYCQKQIAIITQCVSREMSPGKKPPRKLPLRKLSPGKMPLLPPENYPLEKCPPVKLLPVKMAPQNCFTSFSLLLTCWLFIVTSFRGVSKTAATSVMDSLVTLVNDVN